MASREIRVLVVEDDGVIRRFLVFLLKRDPEIGTVLTAEDGEEAMAVIARERPDVVTMDIVLPGIDGLDVTRRIMESSPVPIVVVSSSIDPRDVSTVLHALEAGAVAALHHPPAIGSPGHDAAAGEFVRTVKAMAGVKLVTRRPWTVRPSRPARAPSSPPPAPSPRSVRVVAIGASAGGPTVLQGILRGLDPGFPVPILAVQHIDGSFAEGLATWLAAGVPLPVLVAVDGEAPRPGTVYLAPADRHLGLHPDGRLSVSAAPPESGLRPAVSYLFRTAGDAFGASCVAVLLTGMGADGAAEMKRLHDLGAVTVAQDEASSLVHGMPGEAIRLGGARHVLPPSAIVELLAATVGSGS